MAVGLGSRCRAEGKREIKEVHLKGRDELNKGKEKKGGQERGKRKAKKGSPLQC